MKILHLVPGLDERANGIAVAVRLIAEVQRAEGHTVTLVETATAWRDSNALPQLSQCDEAWVHSMWLPATLRACWRVLRAGVPLVRMTHANLDPLRLHNGSGWKKALVAPVERALFRRAARVVVTSADERAWCAAWGVAGAKIELFDLKQCFRACTGADAIAPATVPPRAEGRPLKVLFMGRATDPLKGLTYLRRAVEGLPVELRVETQAFGAAKDEAFAWCDVLCLPTLSENFGLVVAEALAYGRRAVVTDGASAWADDPRVVYVRGYRDGDDATRVARLREALGAL